MTNGKRLGASVGDDAPGMGTRKGPRRDPAREHDATQTELEVTRERLEYLLAVSPAIIYTTQAAGDYACTFVSANLRSIMGYTPQEMTTDPKGWPARLHPEDAARVLGECPRLVARGGGTLEYRFQHRDGSYIWIQDTFKVVCDAAGRPRELWGPGQTSASASVPSSRACSPTSNCRRRRST